MIKKIEKDYLSKKDNPNFNYTKWRFKTEKRYNCNLSFFVEKVILKLN